MNEAPRVLCRADQIPEGGTLGVSADPEAHYADLVLVRRHGRIYAYRNACPHTGAPMEWQPHRFLDYGGSHIQCGIHGALFRIEDGYCVAGPCARSRLAAVAIERRGGEVLCREPLRRHPRG